MEFTKTTLGEISIGKGQYGIGASAVEYSPDLYTYLRITDINDDGTLNILDLKSVDDPKAREYLLSPNDILFARTGNSTGRNYFYDGSDGEFVYAGFLIKFSLDPNKVNPRFIKYYCLSDDYKGWVQGYSTGSTRGNINAQTYAGMEILLPPRDQQDNLVKILDDLEAKRKTNSAINRNLREQQKTMVTELLLNEDTPTRLLQEISTIKYGKGLPTKYLIEDGYPVFGGNGIIGYYNEFLYEKPQILISCRGAASGNILESLPFSFITSNSLVVELEDYNYFEFLKQYLIMNPLYGYATGSAQPQITIDNIKNVEIPYPNGDDVLELSDRLQVLSKYILLVTKENEKLAQTRDSLLPKLMSGELDISGFDI